MTGAPRLRLQEIRAQLDISQEALAEALNVSHRTCQRYLSGETRIPADVIYAAEALVRGHARHEATRRKK